VDQVIARAKALFPHEHFLAARVKTEARRCARHGGGLSWIDRALELAERKGAEKWGYVAATLKNWREEGGPPAPPPTAEEQKAKRDADIAAATLRLFGARPGGPST
jgi:hypothetical protein